MPEDYSNNTITFSLEEVREADTVSYTHLDEYKRQGWYRVVYTSPHGFWGEVSFCPKPERTEKLRKDRSK